MHIIDSAVCIPAVDGQLQIEPWLVEMQRWDISHAVIAPTDAYVAVCNEAGNTRIAELVSQYPDKLSGLAVANPWYGEEAVRILEKAFKNGMKGMYLHPGRQGFQLTDSVVNPLIEVCAKWKKPVYTHTGTPVVSEPFKLAELARRHPSVIFVLGHASWSDFCGYDVIPAALQAPNILVETSCTTPGMVRRCVDSLGVERVLFGTGYPRSMPLPEFSKIEAANLSPDETERVMSVNARALWGIDK